MEHIPFEKKCLTCSLVNEWPSNGSQETLNYIIYCFLTKKEKRKGEQLSYVDIVE